MYKKWFNIILILISISLVVYCFILNKRITKLKTSPKIEIIDSINTVIDTIYIKNDSLLKSINKSKAVVNNIDDEYKKEYIRISNESVTNDILFFTNYLKEQEARGLFSNNYCDSIKTN